MVQAKNNHTNKKSKPRRQQDTVKKQGMQADISELCAQLDALGLKIIQVTADGNCFFRFVEILFGLDWALADQLEGNENDHQKYREMVVNYIFCSFKEDSCEGPAKPIMIKADAHISAKEHNNKVAIDKSSKGSSSRSTFNSGSVKLVMAGTGIEDIDKVEQVLQEVDGDVDAAIEFLIAEKELDLDHNACSSADNSKGEDLLQETGSERVVGPEKMETGPST
ncbi:hypothetical protein C4D60_Mb01t03690 [Musa balbisiana]|uniref:OTU domain-containing protein n=1 Tax=Musa balbisiana TaxID=52838 RepID=A0A4S8JJV3_MUSBA|nr:hypothetical protein C4D60_Mb01t03690 [Musa balbisiana]